MTRQGLSRLGFSLALLMVATAAFADRSANDDKQANAGARLVLPVTGTGGFSGTVFVQSFQARGNQVVATAFISGSVPGVSSLLAGPITIPVTVGTAGTATSSSSSTLRQAPVSSQQTASTCQVLALNLGAVNLDALGLNVATQPIAVNLAGDTASPLGNLVCTALDTVNNVVNLVGVLNQILGALGGVLGGVTGAVGGVTGG
jgi:hypothetical protein